MKSLSGLVVLTLWDLLYAQCRFADAVDLEEAPSKQKITESLCQNDAREDKKADCCGEPVGV